VLIDRSGDRVVPSAAKASTTLPLPRGPAKKLSFGLLARCIGSLFHLVADGKACRYRWMVPPASRTHRFVLRRCWNRRVADKGQCSSARTICRTAVSAENNRFDSSVQRMR
jgi:hypothetical protein